MLSLDLEFSENPGQLLKIKFLTEKNVKFLSLLIHPLHGTIVVSSPIARV